jgi:hypothetical protein
MNDYAFVYGKFSYQAIQEASIDIDIVSPSMEELDQIISPIWASNSTMDPLDLDFPSNEVVLEAMTSSEKPWEIYATSLILPS